MHRARNDLFLERYLVRKRRQTVFYDKVRISVTLTCDLCGAARALIGYSLEGIRTNAMYHYKWMFKDGKDICPKCRGHYVRRMNCQPPRSTPSGVERGG